MTEIMQASGDTSNPDPAPAESPVRRKLTPKRLIITFVACFLGVLGGTLVANTMEGSGDSSAMGTWIASYGAHYQQVSHDAADVNIDSSATNPSFTIVRSDCVRLAKDVATAQGDPPMPDGSLEPTWSSILVQLKNGAQMCISGIEHRSAAQLTQAGVDLDNAGGKYLQLLKEVNAST